MKHKIVVTITDDMHGMAVISVDEKDLREQFEECQANGANPKLEEMTFQEYTKSLNNFDINEIDKYNGTHFIYGFMECYVQSDEAFTWMRKSDHLTISVKSST